MTEIIRLEISSCLKNIAQVESMIEDLKVQLNIKEDKYFKVRLASVEAVTNAIEHGNNLDEHKKVHIKVCKSTSIFKLTVHDQGMGFDPNILPNPTAPEFLEQPDGRGVFLMRKLADEINFYDGGRCVEMSFYLS